MMKRSIKLIISLVLCLSMLLSTFVIAAYSADAPVTSTEAKTVNAVRVISALDKRAKLTEADVQLVQVSNTMLPEGTITSVSDAVGKYLLTDVVPGEYLTSNKISAESPAENSDAVNIGSSYLVVSDLLPKSGDVSAKLQEIINNNPNRTLYFPDGTYEFDKSVTTPADPAKAVSFKLASYAIFVPSSEYTATPGQGLIRLGAGAKGSNELLAAGSGSSFSGGIIDMNMVAGGIGISVEGGRNTYITNMAFRGAEIAVSIQSDYTVVDNIVTTGTATIDSVGVEVTSSYNTLNNIRSAQMRVGVHITGEGKNSLRNLHPLGTLGDTFYRDWAAQGKPTIAFWDESKGNQFDYCYSDHFYYGFWLGEGNVSQLEGCFVFWYAKMDVYCGLYQEGTFNSVITNSHFDLRLWGGELITEVDLMAYVKAEVSGGKGIIYYPVVNATLLIGDLLTEYRSYLYKS